MFKIGDRIVYPMHGAGIIEDIEVKEILDEKAEYYVLRMPIGNMKVMIPVKTASEIGIREVIEKEDIEDIMTVLKGDKTKMPQNWNRRYRKNMERIKSGDIFEISEVVRNLMLRDDEKSLSTGERKMLTNSRQMLVSELVLVSDKSQEEIETLIDKAIRNE